MIANSEWSIQPKWVKALSLGIGLPAWLLIMIDVLSEDGISAAWVTYVAMALFAAVAVIQMLFIARAFWRMDL